MIATIATGHSTSDLEPRNPVGDPLTMVERISYTCHRNGRARSSGAPAWELIRMPRGESLDDELVPRGIVICSLISFSMTLAVAGWSVAGHTRGQRTDLTVDSIECVVVRRDDLDTTLLAGGDLQPTKQATVTCQVEDVTDSDGTMVLSVIENGAPSKKGMSSAGSIPRRF